MTDSWQINYEGLSFAGGGDGKAFSEGTPSTPSQLVVQRCWELERGHNRPGAIRKVTIVIPTYNEAENLVELFRRLESVIAQNQRWRFSLVIADDSSPDGTGVVAEQYWADHEGLIVSHGFKRGLGSAYLRGFDAAMNSTNPDVIVMMDADLSHPPEQIPELLSRIESGADMAIACRYMHGGGTPDWAWRRRLMSRLANWIVRRVGRLDKVRDCTSGFRAFRANLFPKVEINSVGTRGYAFLTTLLYEFVRGGGRCCEIPLVFWDRKDGSTKLDARDIIEFGFNVVRLWGKEQRQLIRFLTVGISGVVVNLGALSCMVELLGLEKQLLAPLLSVELSIISNFILNDRWTFQDSPKPESWLLRFQKYHMVALSGLVLNLGVYNLGLYVVASTFAEYDYLLAQALSIGAVFIWNYSLSSRWAWDRQTEVQAEEHK